MSQSQIIAPEPVRENISALASQSYARDFLAAYRSHSNSARFSPARLFLIGRAIELSAKAFHFHHGKSPQQVQGLNHSLCRACDKEVLAKYGISLNSNENDELKKADEYYKNKGFEYYRYGKFDGADGPQKALSGWPDLPDEAVLLQLVEKLLAPKLT